MSLNARISVKEVKKKVKKVGKGVDKRSWEW
jgi:hypothetical protein